MKWLLVVNRYLPEYYGGHVIYVKRFAAALLMCGHQVEILTSTNDENLPTIENEDGVIVNRVYSQVGHLGVLRFKQRNHFVQEFHALIQKKKFDIVNIHDAGLLDYKTIRDKKDYLFIFTVHAVHTYELVYDALKSIGIASYKIVDLIKLPLKLPVQYFFETVLISNVDSVFVMSEYVKKTVDCFFSKCFQKKIYISKIGVSEISEKKQMAKLDARRLLSLDDEKKIFISVRRLAPRMGLMNLIKAFKNIDENTHLIIIGKGILFKKLSDYIKKEKLENKVTLAGFISNDTLHYYYCAADCFILPSEQLEGFGVSTIEALNYNLPVIGTPKGATPEILRNFNDDLITLSSKPSDIYKKINYFNENYSRFKNNNHSHKVKKLYNWPDIIKNIVFHINKLSKIK